MSAPTVTPYAHLHLHTARPRSRSGAGPQTLWWTLAACVSAAGLAGAPAQAQDHPRSPSVAQPELDRIGRTIVREGCRKPLSFKRERVVSPGGGLDAVYNTECPGFTFATFAPRVGPASKARPMELKVSAAHPRVPADLGVGATADSVRSKLGLPYETRGEQLVYSLASDRPEEDSLTFEVQGGVVKSLVWSWETD